MREYHALCKRRNACEENETYRAAFIVSSIYNVNRGKGQDPIRPEDFMGKKKRGQSPEQMLSIARGIQGTFGGKPPEG